MAQLVPRRESGELLSLREAVNRLFEESFVRPWVSLFPEVERPQMAIDVYDTDDAVMVEANLPGVKAEDIDVQIRGDVLTIKAESKREKEVSEDKYTYKERAYGVIERSVRLPVDVDVDAAEAKLENGILKLTLPKVEKEGAKKIKIKAG